MRGNTSAWNKEEQTAERQSLSFCGFPLEQDGNNKTSEEGKPCRKKYWMLQ